MENKFNLRKVLKRWGNNLVAVFTLEDELTYELKEGDIVDISDLVKIQKGGLKKEDGDRNIRNRNK